MSLRLCLSSLNSERPSCKVASSANWTLSNSIVQQKAKSEPFFRLIIQTLCTSNSLFVLSATFLQFVCCPIVASHDEWALFVVYPIEGPFLGSPVAIDNNTTGRAATELELKPGITQEITKDRQRRWWRPRPSLWLAAEKLRVTPISRLVSICFVHFCVVQF